MNRLDATRLGIRLIAVMNLVTMVSSIPAVISGIRSLSILKEEFAEMIGTVFAIGLVMPLLVWIFPIAIAFLLWKYTEPLAQKFWDSPKDEEGLISPGTFRDIQKAVFSGVGLYIIANTIPAIFQWIGRSLLYWEGGFEISTFGSWGQLIGLGAKAALGAWLLIGSEGFMKLIDRIRNGKDLSASMWAEERFLRRLLDAIVSQDHEWLAIVCDEESIDRLRKVQPRISSNYEILFRNKVDKTTDYRIRFESGMIITIELWNTWSKRPQFDATDEEISQHIELTSARVEQNYDPE